MKNQILNQLGVFQASYDTLIHFCHKLIQHMQVDFY